MRNEPPSRDDPLRQTGLQIFARLGPLFESALVANYQYASSVK